LTVNPAVVTLHVPDPCGGSIPVRLPLWRPAYTRAQAIVYVKSDEGIAYCLADAATAHQAGNPAAVLVAARVLQARPDSIWPPWLVAAVIDALARGSRRGSTGGRHTYPWVQWRDDAADYLRYRAVEILRVGARRPVPTVFQDVADRLRPEHGEHGAATAATIEKAYQRVIRRTGETSRKQDPYALRYHPRYFPDVATLHHLHAADVLAVSSRSK